MKRIDGRTLDHKTSEFIRQNAVSRYHAGESAASIMSSYGLCKTTIYKWLDQAAAGGASALLAKPIPGRPAKLDESQIAKLRKIIVGGDPRQLGLDLGLWTRQIVAAVIKKEFGIDLGLTAVGRLLYRIGIVPIKPLRRAYERDPQAIKEWRTKTYPDIKKRAKKYGADIFFLDECGVRSDSVLGRTWGEKGKRTTVTTSGQRQTINAISAVNEQGAFWFDVYSGKMTSDLFIDMLINFMKYRRRPAYIILDGHPTHRSKAVASLVQQYQGDLELYFLPGYAPDLNPDEFVWNYVKSEGTSKRPLKVGESLKNRIIHLLQAVKKSPKLIRSFFKSAELAYL